MNGMGFEGFNEYMKINSRISGVVQQICRFLRESQDEFKKCGISDRDVGIALGWLVYGFEREMPQDQLEKYRKLIEFHDTFEQMIRGKPLKQAIEEAEERMKML